MKKIAVLGPFPPPVHGMAKNTKIIADELARSAHVIRLDTSPGSLVRGAGYHFRKLKKILASVIKLCFLKDVTALYTAVDAGWGMVYSFIFLKICELKKIPVFMHHRSFAYIDKKSRIMESICELKNISLTHIFLCSCMERKFSKNYGEGYEFRIVSNAKYAPPVDQIESRESRLFTIGHLSNLGDEKGLTEVLQVAEKLKLDGFEFILKLAGPPSSPAAADKIRHFQNLLGESLIYIGPVAHDQKSDYYKSIDIFLFPTKYKNEAQPNVVFEALSFGAPVLSLSKGCIADDLEEGGGAVFEDNNYVERSVEYIKNVSTDAKKIQHARLAALAVSERHYKSSLENYDVFINEILSR